MSAYNFCGGQVPPVCSGSTAYEYTNSNAMHMATHAVKG